MPHAPKDQGTLGKNNLTKKKILNLDHLVQIDVYAT
jgi:hypothetical protein